MLGMLILAALAIGGHIETSDRSGDVARVDSVRWDVYPRVIDVDAIRAVGVGDSVPGGVVDAEPDPEPAAVRLPDVPAAAVAPVVPQTDIERIVCSFAWPCGEALNVMWCESGGMPDAVSAGGHRGLFQLATGWATNNPDYWSRWMDPWWNAATAFNAWSRKGWQPWSCR